MLGASWEKDRGRELRGKVSTSVSDCYNVDKIKVAPTAFTTFYVGGLANACALLKDVSIFLLS